MKIKSKFMFTNYNTAMTNDFSARLKKVRRFAAFGLIANNESVT